MKLNPFKKLIGLDISDYKIRFVEINSKNQSKLKISCLGEIDTPAGLISAGEFKNENEVTGLLKNCFNNPLFGKIDTKYISASLPEKKTFIKVIEIPTVPENELKGAVAWGIEKNIPVTMDQIYYDWQVLQNTNNSPDNILKVIVCVAPKELSDRYTRVIKNAHFIPINLENESIAISRCLLNHNLTNKNSVVIIDLGRSRTNLIMYDQGNVLFSTTLEISGHQMTQNISNQIKLDYQDAEKAKLIYGLDRKKAKGEIAKILELVIDKLVIKIKENIDYFNNYIISGRNINEIILTGSVSQMLGVVKYISAKMSLSVKVGEPAQNLTQKLNIETDINKKLFSFATAIGLGIKKIA